MAIRELVYMSEAVPEITDDDIARILKTCRQNNSERGITGLLVYSDGVFVQVLEGEDDRVNDLFDSISKDSRHTDAEVLSDQTVDQRRFSKWAMGFIETDPKQIGVRLGMDCAFNRAELLSMLSNEDGFASKILWSFVETHDLEI